MNIHRLHADGRRLVTKELISGEIDRWPERAYAELLMDAPCELLVDELDRVLDDTIHSFAPYDAAIDRDSAPHIHRALRLTRRQASDPALWRFLTVVHRPDFVRHRWENRSLTVMKNRFWSLGTRPDSNAIARLWWIAELTRAGDDYGLTGRVLTRQHLCTSLFVRNLCWYRPIVAACTDVLEDASAPIVEQSLRRLSRTFSTVLLESRDETQLRQLVARARAKCS